MNLSIYAFAEFVVSKSKVKIIPSSGAQSATRFATGNGGTPFLGIPGIVTVFDFV